MLYTVNFISITFALAWIASTSLELKDHAKNPTVPVLFLELEMIIATIMLAISVVGLVATFLSTPGKPNCTLTVYYVLMILFGLSALVAAGFMFYLRAQVGFNRNQTPEAAHGMVNSVDTWFDNYISGNPSNWIEMENYLHCCGYYSTSDSSATGSACLTGGVPCRPHIMSKMFDTLLMAGLASLLVFGLLVLTWTSSCCLLCCAYTPVQGGTTKGKR